MIGDTKLQKLPPWLPVPCSPGKSILESEQSLFYPKMMLICLSACSLLNWSSCKCHHQKKWRRGAQVHKTGPGANSRAWALSLAASLAWARSWPTPPQEGSDSEIGISIEDETNPKVSHLRISQRLLALTNLPQLEGVPDDARKMDLQILQLPRELVTNINSKINLLMIW